jgi:class II lanthipeptide synthase
MQVAAAADAVLIHSPTSYSWFGTHVDAVTPQARSALTPEAARGYLAYSLQQQLYADFYCTGAPTPRAEAPRGFASPGELRFVEELSAANGGHGSWESGWTVREPDGERIVVTRGGLDVWVEVDECAPLDGGRVAPGAQVRVRFPKELTKMSPGFYVALGDGELEWDRGVVRFYWNLTEAAAVPFVSAATAALNDAGLPFRLKVVNDRSRFDRCDSAVIYTRRGDYADVARVLATIHAAVGPALREPPPALTKPLAPGVSFAEDPATGDSFGLHRCRVLADGIVAAAEADARTRDERLEVIATRFTDQGISLERPYLNDAATDDYALPLG